MSLHAAIMADVERDELITELRDEIQRLRAIIEGDGSAQAQLQRALKLTAQQAWVLWALYDLRGGVLTRDRAKRGLPATFRDPEEVTANLINVLVCRVRKVLPPGSIETVHGTGFALSTDGIAWVSGILR